MAKAPTPYMAFQLPVPGSKEPFRVSDVNEWFQTIDTKFQTSDGVQTGLDTRLDAIEPFLLPGFAEPAAKHGLVPAGTSAERDAYWGTPASATARVELANRNARWFNTDKGYEQQYYAQFDDAGVGAAPARDVFGWYAASHLTEVPLSKFTLGGSAGTFSKRGGVAVGTASALLTLDGVFSADFKNYKIVIDITAMSAASDLIVNLRAAGVTDSAVNYAISNLQVSAAGATTSGTSGGETKFIVGWMAVVGGWAEANVTTPFEPRRTGWIARSWAHSMEQTFRGGVNTQLTNQYDGFTLQHPTGNFTGRVRVFGINDY